MPAVKDLNVFVIMSEERGYYSTRTGGSAFREDPTQFTLYRNYTNADKYIRREVKNLEKQVADLKSRDDLTGHLQSFLQNRLERLEEWKKAEVVRIVD